MRLIDSKPQACIADDCSVTTSYDVVPVALSDLFELSGEHFLRPTDWVGGLFDLHNPVAEVALPHRCDQQTFAISRLTLEQPLDHAHLRAARVAQLILASGARR